MNPIRSRESVCRSLFGPVDHDQLRRDLKMKLKEITEQDSRRWNFNFQTETPLPGRFQWEEVPAHCAAALYQECAQLQDDDATACWPKTESNNDDILLGAATNQENCSSISNTTKFPGEVTPVRRKRKTTSKLAVKPRSNARITGKETSQSRTHHVELFNPVV